MAAPSISDVTYPTFADATVAYGTQVIQDITDVIAFLTDGSKDFSIGALTTAGAVTLGNAAADAITINGTLSSNLLPTAATYTLGSATYPFVSLSLDNGVTDGGKIYFNAGTTYYLGASAAGTTLTAAGFTTLTASSLATLTTAASLTAASTTTLSLGASCAINVASGDLLLDQTNQDVLIGDGTDTGTESVIIRADTGDAQFGLRVGNASASTWLFTNDNSDSDKLKMTYGGSATQTFDTAGNIATGGQTTSHALSWKVVSGAFNAAGTATIAHGLTVTDIRGMVSLGELSGSWYSDAAWTSVAAGAANIVATTGNSNYNGGTCYVIIFYVAS